jgi:type II secretory pathway pseudopilin PulG
MESLVAILITAIILTIAIPWAFGALQDAKKRHAESNTQSLNQAASRGRLANIHGPGTFGSDKRVAWEWYLEKSLSSDRSINLEYNSFINGEWITNRLGEDLDRLIKETETGKLSRDDSAELILRFREISPQLLAALAQGGYLKVTEGAIKTANQDGSCANLELHGNTIISTKEMNEILEEFQNAISKSQTYSISSQDPIVQDPIGLQALWSNPDTLDQAKLSRWKWDEKTERFIPNLGHPEEDFHWASVTQKINNLPEGSSLKDTLLESLSIRLGENPFEELEDWWETSPEKLQAQDWINSMQTQWEETLMPTARQLLQVQDVPPEINLQTARQLPIAERRDNLEIRKASYRDRKNKVWAVEVQSPTDNPKAGYTLHTFEEFQPNPSTKITAETVFAMTAQGNIPQERNISILTETGYGPASARITKNSQGEDWPDGLTARLETGDEAHQISGEIQSGASRLEQPARWAEYLYTSRPPKSVHMAEEIGKTRLQFTNPQAYAAQKFQEQ